METTIRPLTSGDETAWRTLWRDYCAFYGQTLAPETTQTLWNRLMDADTPVNGAVAARADTDALLGFTHYVLHPHTWSDKTLCYLEDLYVSPEARGQNVGHALISHLVETGTAQGWGRVYWHTETGNAPARRLYDRFTSADDFVRYTVKLPR
ncbi:MAG: GNAT family N-acetyltransferase [Armatimonadetes bacterium]|nr:GNAT family N-acetyltransferase [Armatimonadota bacterium]